MAGRSDGTDGSAVPDGSEETDGADAVGTQGPDRPAPPQESGDGETTVGSVGDFTRLVPVSLQLVAEQLDRIGFRYDFTDDRDAIVAGWPRFQLRVRVSPRSTLMISITMSTHFGGDSLLPVISRCNAWNRDNMFLKAVATSTMLPPREVDGVQRPAVNAVRVNLDYEVPLPAGVAAVQLQALLRQIPDNVANFASVADFDTYVLGKSSTDQPESSDDPDADR